MLRWQSFCKHHRWLCLLPLLALCPNFTFSSPRLLQIGTDRYLPVSLHCWFSRLLAFNTLGHSETQLSQVVQLSVGFEPPTQATQSEFWGSPKPSPYPSSYSSSSSLSSSFSSFFFLKFVWVFCLQECQIISTDSYKCDFWGLNLSPLENQLQLLTAVLPHPCSMCESDSFNYSIYVFIFSRKYDRF